MSAARVEPVELLADDLHANVRTQPLLDAALDDEAGPVKSTYSRRANGCSFASDTPEE